MKQKQSNKTPKHNISLNWWYDVVHTTGCIRSCCTKLSNSKAVFEHSLPVGCYLQAVIFLLLSMRRNQWQVFCFWHISALEFMGFFLFSKEAFIKCCYSPLCVVNNHRLKYKRRKEFLLPADSEQK